jgi:hypothetical protein
LSNRSGSRRKTPQGQVGPPARTRCTISEFARFGEPPSRPHIGMSG